MRTETIRDVDVKSRPVLVRVDFNVPLDKQTRQVMDDTRIRAALPTIRYLIDHGAKVILCSHLGRPDGKIVEALRLDPVAKRLSELLGQPVKKIGAAVGPEAQAAEQAMKPGEVLLLENIRFYPGEESNDPDFARELSSLAQIYVNDAFGTAHRAHASTEGVATFLPAYAGLLMEKEIEALSRALTNPARPFAAVIGGAKVSDKIKVLQHLVDKVDTLLIGGGMANTFLLADGYQVGDSLVESDRVDAALDIMSRANQRGVKLLLPKDVVIADSFSADAVSRAVPATQVPNGWRILDIGPETVESFSQELKRCQTVLWNGPMGVFEFPRFAEGTRSIARVLAELNATTIIGGGESVAAVEQLGLSDRMTHVSTGGGATLEFLEGRVLPGVAVLRTTKN
ncbi:MAG: phosphoglycerate kinase [Chloroflexota bacterium]|nr:MAG: phosphoglycerate kinase [Chloroflexota bacterium]